MAMKRVLLGIFTIVLFFGISEGGIAGSSFRILPFKVWKQKKIDEAKAVVAELKRKIKKLSQVKIDDGQGDETTQELSQATLNLAVMKELSANDYFLLYVSPQFKSDNDALLQAAKTFSAHDMADILLAYQKRLQAAEVTPSVEATDPGEEANFQEKTAKSP